MTEGLSLLLVLVIIYLYDCVITLHRQAVAVTRPWRGWRFRLPDSPLGSRSSAILMLQPLPPLGTVYEVAQWPVSLSDQGVCAFSSVSLPGTERPQRSGAVILYRDIREVESRERDIVINGQVFAPASSGAQAARVAELIRSAARAPVERRMKLVTDAIDASLDVDAARSDSAALGGKTFRLRVACNTLWVYLYLACPLATACFGLAWLIVPLATGLLLIHIPIAVWFARLHARLYPGERGIRARQVFSMAICPPMAIRAVDSLSRHGLSLYHPAAAIAALCPNEDASALAGALARDLRYPAPIPLEGDAARVESSFRSALAAGLRAAMRKHGIALSDTPALRHLAPDSRSFCPRCLTVFTVRDGTCQDCFNLKLEPLPDRPAADKENR